MTQILSGLLSVLQDDQCALYNRSYRVNDWRRMTVWDGYSAEVDEAGIESPEIDWDASAYASTAGGGSVDEGVHFIRYRYLDSKTQYPSNPTRPVQVEVAAGDTTIYVSNTAFASSPDGKVDRVLVEMTRANGSEFFQLTAMPNEAKAILTVYASDNDLLSLPLIYEDFGHEIPPYFRICTSFRERIWGAGHIVMSEGTVHTSGDRAVFSAMTLKSAAVGRILRVSGVTSTAFIKSISGTDYAYLDRSISTVASGNAYKIIPDAPDVLNFSKSLYPQSWPVQNQIKVLDGEPDKARALKGFRNDLVIFGERKKQVLVFVNDPFEDGRLEWVEGERGAASQRCVVDARGTLWSLDYKGVYKYSGGTGGQADDHISEFLDPYFDPADRDRGYVDFQYRDKFHALHYPQRHQILWFVVINGDPADATSYTEPHHALVYDYRNQTWGVLKFDVAMTASENLPGSDGTTYPVIADENGHLWVYGIGDRDGPAPSNPDRFTIRTMSSSTLLQPQSASLFEDDAGLAGVYIYSPDEGVGGVVMSNSASGLQLNVALASLLSAGTSFEMGRIPAKLKSKRYNWPESRKARARYLHMFFEPQDDGEAELRVYTERSTSPFVAQAAHANAGVSISTSASRYLLDLSEKSGYFRVPLPATMYHVLEWELDIVKAGTEMVLFGYALDGHAEEKDTEL